MSKSGYVCPEFPEFIDIMGSIWQIEMLNYKDDPYFENEHADGYCSGPEKKIGLCNPSTFPGQEKEQKQFLDNSVKNTLRHEIVHAYFYESGLADSAFVCCRPWAKNEEMVDWFANQGAKIYKTWQECGCLYTMNPEAWAKWTAGKAEKEKKNENH